MQLETLGLENRALCRSRQDLCAEVSAINNSKTKYKIYPIEVKSGVRYTTDSLLRFREKYEDRIGGCYIIHTKNLIERDGILCIPPYMTGCL